MNPAVRRTFIALAGTCFLLGGCAKKVAVATPPPAPAKESPRSTPVESAATTAPRTPAPRAVSQAPESPRYPNAATRARIDELLARIEDAYFDYDKATLRADAQKALQADSTELRNILKDYPDYKLTIEGHCDERGSAEYNLALGDRRAAASKEYLVSVGIPSDQLNLVSYGKERPVCTDQTEACWQRNRRIHIVALNR